MATVEQLRKRLETKKAKIDKLTSQLKEEKAQLAAIRDQIKEAKAAAKTFKSTNRKPARKTAATAKGRKSKTRRK